ncbi:MAG TPA: hypothetical protein VK325_08870, partial [Pseudoxanthomonas sp.]|nr:hypothetical protein [Pseudoxanthomonas sp.]
RFLQADPVIQAPDNAQSWNAYTYVFNNPLAYTDPSGMISIGKAFRMIAAVAITYFTAGMAGPYFAAFLAGGAGAGTALATGLAIAAAGGFAAGVVATGTLQGGVRGAFTAALTAGIGISGLDAAGQVAAQAVTGGIMESLQGGSFGHGFAAAGLTAAFMPQVGKINNDVARTAVGALVGGTISEATGGKFANGAVSEAIQAAMAGRNEQEAGLEKQANTGEISDQAGAPPEIAKLLRDPATAQEGLRRMAKWDGLLVPEHQIIFEDVPYFRVNGFSAAAKMNMSTGVISFSRAGLGNGDYWIALSNMKHEHGHWLDWRFNLGYQEVLEIRAYEFQVRDQNFGRTPAWYQNAIRKQLRIEQDTYACKERATC